MVVRWYNLYTNDVAVREFCPLEDYTYVCILRWYFVTCPTIVEYDVYGTGTSTTHPARLD